MKTRPQIMREVTRDIEDATTGPEPIFRLAACYMLLVDARMQLQELQSSDEIKWHSMITIDVRPDPSAAFDHVQDEVRNRMEQCR